jgi:hypothetical protein
MNCSRPWLEMLISLRRSLYCFLCKSVQEENTPIFSRDVDTCLSSFVLTLIFSASLFVTSLMHSLINLYSKILLNLISFFNKYISLFNVKYHFACVNTKICFTKNLLKLILHRKFENGYNIHMDF